MHRAALIQPLDVCLQCASHCLNLAVVKSLTVTSVRNNNYRDRWQGISFFAARAREHMWLEPNLPVQCVDSCWGNSCMEVPMPIFHPIVVRNRTGFDILASQQCVCSTVFIYIFVYTKPNHTWIHHERPAQRRLATTLGLLFFQRLAILAFAH